MRIGYVFRTEFMERFWEFLPFAGVKKREKQPEEDSNLQIGHQKPLCYHYTIGFTLHDCNTHKKSFKRGGTIFFRLFEIFQVCDTKSFKVVRRTPPEIPFRNALFFQLTIRNDRTESAFGRSRKSRGPDDREIRNDVSPAALPGREHPEKRGFLHDDP